MPRTAWAQPVSGLWSTSANWSSGQAPGLTDSVTINGFSTPPYTIAIATPAAALNLTLASPTAELLDLAALRIGHAFHLRSGALALGQGARLEGGTVTLGPDAHFQSTGGTLTDLIWQGPLTLAGGTDALTIGAGVTLESATGAPHTQISLDGTLTFLASTALNATINFGGSGLSALANHQLLTLDPLSRVNVGGDGYFGSGTLLNEGLISDTNPSASYFFLSPRSFLNTGTIHAANGGEIRAAGDTNWTNAGHIDLNNAVLYFSAPSQFTNAGTIALANSASLDLLPVPGNAGHAANDGLISLLTHANLSIETALTGTGTIALGAHTTAFLPDGAPMQNFDFAGPGADLTLGLPENAQGLIEGFGSGDVIDLLQTQADTLSVTANTLILTDRGAEVATLHLLGNYSSGDFTMTPDRSGGTLIRFV